MRTNFFPSSHLMFLSLFLSLTSALVTVRLVEAQPSPADAVCFLEQSTFGPTPELIARVRQAGFEAFLDEQLAAPISDYLELPFWPMLNNRCQTRTPPDISICRNGRNAQPNENYAREILQLFSIGTFLLNQDGTRQLDANGNPIPTYDQKIVEEFARVFTGWILAPALPGPEGIGGTVPNYRDPMRVRVSGGFEDYHDKGPKTLLNGLQLPGGQSQAVELGAAIDNIAFDPNVAPFISKQLIQHLVTSNPSPAYVARITSVFASNSNSPTQLYDVVRAILLDPEARGDFIDPATQPNYGKLREPVQFITNLLRAFNATSDGVLNSLNVGGSSIGSADMSQDVFNAPSVFSFYPPTARVPGENALGWFFRLFPPLPRIAPPGRLSISLPGILSRTILNN